MCQMFFHHVNWEFLANFGKFLIYMVKKHLTHEICQRKLGHVKGGLIVSWCHVAGVHSFPKHGLVFGPHLASFAVGVGFSQAFIPLGDTRGFLGEFGDNLE